MRRLRWTLAHDDVTTVAYGTHKQSEFLNALQILNNLQFTEEDRSLLDQIEKSDTFKIFEAEKTKQFLD